MNEFCSYDALGLLLQVKERKIETLVPCLFTLLPPFLACLEMDYGLARRWHVMAHKMFVVLVVLGFQSGID